jgi:ArsR family transcriptional regulator, arsenate/arsenite/antimonite-responsive transcriptional repressor
VDEAQALAGLAALSQGTRLRLYRLLLGCGTAGLSAGNIAERLGIVPSSLSFHLQNLVQAGLITQHRVGRLMIYAAAQDTMKELLAYLSATCAEAPTAAA